MRAVHARLAGPTDLDAVVPVLASVRADSPLGPHFVNPDADLHGHLRAWHAQPHTHLAIAEADEHMVGAALAQVIEANLFTDVVYLQIEALYVHTDLRRRGAGRALMGQLALVAARAGAEQIVTMPISGSRSEQRFLSGLGFTAVGAHRIIATAALLRRLEQQVKGRERRNRGIDELIARRRRSRGLPPTPPAGVSLSELADRAEDTIADGVRGRDQVSFREH